MYSILWLEKYSGRAGRSYVAHNTVRWSRQEAKSVRRVPPAAASFGCDFFALRSNVDCVVVLGLVCVGANFLLHLESRRSKFLRVATRRM